VTPTSPNAYAQAVGAYQRGDLSLARQLLGEAIRTSPHHADAHHLLAVLLAQGGLLQEAEQTFLKAIELAPKRYDYVTNYALSLHDRGELERAAGLFQQVVRAKPDFAPAVNGLGSAIFRLGETVEAEKLFHHAIKLQPSNPQHHNNLGNVLKARNLVADAIESYGKAINLAPQYAEAHFNLGVVLKEAGRLQDARASLTRALELKPGYAQVEEQLEQLAPYWDKPLIGQWVSLRRYSERDADFLYSSFRNAAFMARYNRSIPSNEPMTKLRAALRNSERTLPWISRSIDWVIHLKDESGAERPIGMMNLVDLDFRNKRAEYIHGIVDSRDYHPKHSLEVFLLVLDFAFNQVRLNKLTSIVYEDNPQSQSLTLHLGFKQEGFRPRHMFLPEKGFIGLYDNGMTVDDFRSNRQISKLSQRWLGRDVTQALQK